MLLTRFAVAGAMLASLFVTAASAQTETMTLDGAETAQISGFMEGWDEPILDQRRFDAAHRRLLVRFPDAAEAIADKLEQGYRVEKAELLLPFRRTELYPQGYRQRNSFGVGKMYEEVRPKWHAIAWALRHPWTADEELGPTFNAWINDAAFWQHAGAQSDESDRYPHQFGPAEVSIFQARGLEDPMVGEDAVGGGTQYVHHGDKQPSVEEAIIEDPSSIEPGAMDVTASLTDPAYGQTLGQRLRRLADAGFMLRKWETYDFRYRDAGSYPWGASTGGRAIAIHPPKLKVTFAEGQAPSVDVPAPAEIAQLAEQVEGTDRAGQRPLALPSDQEIQRRLNKHGFTRRDWMTDWQWQRLKELRQYGGRSLPETPEQYKAWVKDLLTEQPRYWDGWDNAERLLEYYRYAETLPDYVAKHYFHDYWTAWLQPKKPHQQLVHPWPHVSAGRDGQTNPNTYYRKTGDWRGNASFYRGYTRNMGTMNFNHTATMGALLGGAIIDSEYAVQDGRKCSPTSAPSISTG